MKEKGRVAVLLSGRGSNFEAIHCASQNNDANYQVALVISDCADAAGLQKAKAHGIPAHFIPPGQFSSKREYERQLITLLEQYRIELICLAGFMRLIGPELRQRYRQRIMNIHPALLPAFPGLHAQKQAIEHGVKVSGCTVHFIDANTDTGPIILQSVVPVLPGDSEQTLSERILVQEHATYPRAIRLFFAGRLHISGRTVIIGQE